MAIARVGERPRQSEVRPSLRAILRRPSMVEVKVRCLASSAAHSAAIGVEEEEDKAGFIVVYVTVEEGLAMQ